MTEDELKALKDTPAPRPRAEAKAAALAAAMAAFDAASELSAKNIGQTPQGSERGSRHMHASENTRRRKMRAPMLYKIAAGIAVIVVATPAAVYFLDHGVMQAYRPTVKKQESERPFPDGKKLIHDDLANRTENDGPAPIAGKTEDPAPVPGGTLEERINRALSGAKEQSGVPAGHKQDAPKQPEAPAGGSITYDRLAGEASGSGSNAMPPQASPPPPPSSVQRGQSRHAATSPATDGRIVQSQPSAPADAKSAIAPTPRRKSEEKVAGQFGETRLDTTLDAAKKGARPPTDDGLAMNTPGWNAAADRLLGGKPAAEPSPAKPAFAGRLDVDERPVAAPEPEEHRDQFDAPTPNPVKQVAAEPVSTFSADVDTASYAFVRRALNQGHLPPKDAVRVEEMINYFPYDYPRPETAATPFQPTVTVTPAPWKPTDKLVHIAIKGYDIVPAERPRANLVFLIDVSGSMQPADRLPLVKNAFRLMLDELKPDDTVGIVTYASGSGIALKPTRVADKSKILAAIDALGAGGSTAGAAGIADAYRLAEAHFDKAGVNRIILATDGDFNVGISNRDELKGFVERKRAGGIFLSILGVGEGNYNDAMMQALAQNGNGTAAYVDTLNEARKVLVDEASSTLFTIAKDVKIQMEFNPSAVSEYRLIGYETRALAREDFNNDKVDAGDIGSGHTVTAIYEVTPVGAPKLADDLRYGQPATPPAATGQASELGFLKLRYKLPMEDASKLISLPIGPALEKPDIAAAPEDVRFSVAVAGFGQILRGLPYLGGYGYDDVLALAQGARGADPFGYRAEFLNLVRLAKSARP